MCSASNSPEGTIRLRYDRAMNVAYNRGKRSMTLDLRHERAGEVLRRLVRNTDVLIESARPGSMDQRGIGYKDLADANPRLVWCSITGFGRGSPYADRPAHDVTFLGYAGLLSMMVGDTVPAAPQFIIAVPLGALMATVGVLVALQDRERTGIGTQIDTSVVDSATWVLGEHITRAAQGNPVGWGDTASRRTYRCADGRLITLGAAEPRTWGALCDALERPDLVDRLTDADQDALHRRVGRRLRDPALGRVGRVARADGRVPRPGEHTGRSPRRPACCGARSTWSTLDDASGEKVFANPLRFVDDEGSARLHRRPVRRRPPARTPTKRSSMRASPPTRSPTLHESGAV